MPRVSHHFFCHVGVFDAAFCCGSARGAGRHGTIRGRGGGAVYCVADSLFVLMQEISRRQSMRQHEECGLQSGARPRAIFTWRSLIL